MPIFNSLLTFKSHRNANDEHPYRFDRSRLTIQQVMLVRSLLNEFYSSAKLTATFASIVSARRRGLKLQNVSRPVAYIPSDPLIFPAVAAGLSPALDSHELMNGLQDYYARVAFARALSEISALVGEADDLGHRELAQLDDVWQQVCALANIVAHHLFDVENVDDPARKYQLISIQELINAAKSGRSPCVRSDGTVFVPGWLDQRREERLAAGWQVWIEYGGDRKSVV